MGGGHDSGKAVISLVQSYTAQEVLDVLRTGRWDPMFDRTHQDAFCARVEQSRCLHVTLDDWRVLAQYSQLFGKPMDARRLADSDVVTSVVHAKNSIRDRETRLSMLAEFGIGAADRK